MMDERIKAKWLEALRSGKYVQGKEYLKRKVGLQIRHCCLGVLCELYAEEHPEYSFVENDGVYRIQGHIGGSTCSDLDPEVREWSGIRSPLAKLPRTLGERFENLAGLNDSGEFTFQQIADVIEAQF